MKTAFTLGALLAALATSPGWSAPAPAPQPPAATAQGDAKAAPAPQGHMAHGATHGCPMMKGDPSMMKPPAGEHPPSMGGQQGPAGQHHMGCMDKPSSSANPAAKPDEHDHAPKP